MRKWTKRPDDKTPVVRRWWFGYGVAVGGTIVAAVARWALGQAAKDLPTFITFYPIALIAAWVGGTGPGLFATGLSILAANVLFMEPVGMLGPATLGQAVGMAVFIVTNSTISILAGRLRAKSEVLEESEARLQMAHQAAHIGAFEWNLQTGINSWTPELEAMYGLKAGEFGRTESAWEQLVHPEDRARAVKAVERALATFKPEEGEWRVVWPDGTIHWLIGRFQAFRDHSEKASCLVGVNIDITGRKEAEHMVRQSAQRFRALETAGSYAVYTMSPDWSEMRALHGREFIADTNEPSRNWLEKYIDPKDQPAVLAAIHNAINNKAVFESEHRVRRADGKFGWTFSRAVPVQDENGEIVEWVGTASDVTERKEAEQAVRQSNAELEQKVEERTAKLREAMGELEHMSYSMIHDMRAPLRAMQGFAEVLQQECEECRRPPGANYLRIIRESAYRLDRLVTDVLNYNKVVREGLPLRPVDLGELLRGMVQTYPNLQGADIRVEFADLLVLGNESLLTQCFGNLLDNAVKFVAEGVKPQVRVWTEPSTIDEQPATSICIDDNGIGIPKAAQERIFRMFQRMHPETEYPGTGIGLAIARKAVERMNGRISLESEPGKGTRFQIELPRPAEAQINASVRAAA